MIHLRSALRLMAIDSLFVICRLAPSMWPSSRMTRSQCTCMPHELLHSTGGHIVYPAPHHPSRRLTYGQQSLCDAPGQRGI